MTPCNPETLAYNTPMGGGFYAGRIAIDGNSFALIVAPKADGISAATRWIGRSKAAAWAREQALEDAAKVCKSRAASHASVIREDEADDCATAILALKVVAK